MKKLFAVLTALLPVIYIGGIFTVLKLENDDLLWPAAGIFLLFALIVHIVYVTLTKNSPRRFLTISNIWIIGTNFLFHITKIIVLIVITIDVQIRAQQGAQEGGLIIALLFMFSIPNWITYAFTRIAASINCYRAMHDIVHSTKELLHILLHLFPLADLISAILVLRKVNRFQDFQQPPIEIE